MRTVVQGIIIREKVSDEDRLLTLLTSERGVIHAVAKGANRARAKLVSSTGLFCYGQFGLFCLYQRRKVSAVLFSQNCGYLGQRKLILLKP
jgi:recombinational DNA repair protein (RecF pathway)